MITNKQKWLLGSLITFSAAVWTPQIMERVGGDTRAQVGVDSGPNEEEMLSIEMETTDLAPGTARPVANVPAVRSTEPSGTPVTPLAMGDGQLSAGGSSAIVSEVLRSLRQTEAFSVDSEIEDDLAEERVAEIFEEPVAEPPSLMVFLESHPLRGTIVGDTTKMALIGQHRVHLGDIVPGTGAVLADVKRGRVVIEEGDMSVELTLKPLETSTALMNARSQAQGAGTSAGASEADLPDPEAAPEPTPGASASPSQEPQGSQGDF
jgi:hypothetical protein